MAADGGVLARIGARTAERIAREKHDHPVGALREHRLYARLPRSLTRALCAPAPCVIAEIKFASPSEGVLRPDATVREAARIAGAYAKAGAAAISVLTEPEFFGGSTAFLAAARDAEPGACLLMKDFFVDPYQFEAARACGADAILLIAALLGPRLPEMAEAARALGLSALVEVHDESEAEAALAIGADAIGVNSRDLRTLKTDLDVARRLAPRARRGAVAVAESGLRSRAEIDELSLLGYKGFLIGTTFMKSDDPGAALKALLNP
ncbi:MAG: indole-3-glycerol-phosphate synthase [Elusimicrobia bacterium]|nr:indole-3-glycerol-phosphate synthase [Elusimicrobiota bacterium]